MNRLTRRFLFIVLAIVATLPIGTVGFTGIEHWQPFDAFYMTLTTMTTVGTRWGTVRSIRYRGQAASSTPS
jgi:voltage-gated potassium channel